MQAGETEASIPSLLRVGFMLRTSISANGSRSRRAPVCRACRAGSGGGRVAGGSTRFPRSVPGWEDKYQAQVPLVSPWRGKLGSVPLWCGAEEM